MESIEQCFVNSWSFTTHLSTATGTVKRRYSSANMWTLGTPHLFICSAIWNICFKELVNLNKITWITVWCHFAWPSDADCVLPWFPFLNYNSKHFWVTLPSHFNIIPRSISHFCGVYQRRRYMYLLPGTKIAPENGWLEDYSFLSGWLPGRCELLVSGSVIMSHYTTILHITTRLGNHSPQQIWS